MALSAFGVDHGDTVSKAERKPASGGRLAVGAVVPGWHGLAAGKKGKGRKLKAAATEYGGAVGGIAAGTALSRGSRAAAAVGGLAGGAAGTNVAHKAGWLKRER